jgi:peptidoglycan/LPS O-acetylase OafA/YrhL
MPELDALRGVASLAVVFYHGLYWARDFTPFTLAQRRVLFAFSPGQFGVNLFFVLSGFLITGLLLDSRGRRDYYRRFYIRRALRILPAYYALLLILALSGIASRPFLAMSFFYSANLSVLFGIAMSYPVLWSLAVEEHFYLAWPAVVHRIPMRWLAAIAVGIIVASPLLRVACYCYGVQRKLTDIGCDHFTWNTADGLACGALLAIGLRHFHPERKLLLRSSMACIAAAAVIAAAGARYGIVTRLNPVGASLQGVPWNIGFVGMLGLALLAGTSRWKALVTPRWLTFFGSISYGLYMVHLLVFAGYDRLMPGMLARFHGGLALWPSVWFRFAVAASSAVLVSCLSRWYLEEPFLRLKSKLT